MNRTAWNLDQLKLHLSQRKEVKGWIVNQETVQRREKYFLNDRNRLATDQDRDVHSQSLQVRVFTRLPQSGRQGETTQRFFTDRPLANQVDSAVAAAMQTDHQAWDLPATLPTGMASPRTSDPKIGEDLEKVMGELTDQMNAAFRKKRDAQFNSAELFVSMHQRELYLSNGLTHRSSQSRIYTEAAYSYSKEVSPGNTESDEFLSTRWSVSLQDLSIEKLFDETAERAQHSIGLVKPRTGTYPVIIDAEVLATLMNDYFGHLTGSHAYLQLPFRKPGEDFIPEASGDLISLTLDPLLEYGAHTTAISDQGLAQKPLKLVDQNRIQASALSQQYGQYLGLAPTTSEGNLVLDPGTLPHEEMIRAAPEVIEILQFSGLFVDPISATFGSEIRLAKHYDNRTGVVTYLKGGSLSGSIPENFRKARLTPERVKHAHFASGGAFGSGYYGPAFALLSDVSVVG